MVFHGFSWFFKELDPWGPMGTHGDPMGTHGNPWEPMGTHGDPWGPMGIPWEPWEPMGTHGDPWESMGSHGSHGTPWGPHGVPMGPHGAPMASMENPRMSKIMDFNKTHYSVRQKIGDPGSISIRNMFPLNGLNRHMEQNMFFWPNIQLFSFSAYRTQGLPFCTHTSWDRMPLRLS